MNVSEIAPGIWDGRSAVSNPLGRLRADGSVIKMGTLVGQATHHTVRPMLPADATIEQELADIRAIDTYHKARGWGGFAYHGIAYASGRFWLCGNLDGRRAHVEGRNHELHGVAFGGDFSGQMPPDEMMRAGANGLAYIREQAGGIRLPIKGHRLWGIATICPGLPDSYDWETVLNPPTPPEPPPEPPTKTVVAIGVGIRFSDGSLEERHIWP